MELAPDLHNNKEVDSYSGVTISSEVAKELAMLALMSALDLDQNHDNYASGPDFPNIPFGD